MRKELQSPRGSRFARRDFDFIASVLASAESRRHLEKLWSDEDGRREILDLREIFRALTESPAVVGVSPGLYFYVLVRHTFLRAGLEDVELADHVSGELARRVAADGSDPLQDVTRGFTHASDFLSFIASARGGMRHHLQVAAGNQFLVLAGLYPEFIRKRNRLGLAPDVEYYESFAARSFRGAADCCPPCRDWSRHLYGTLAEVMPQARLSLNRLAEEYLFLGE